MAGIIRNIIERSGGLEGLIHRFEQNGLSTTIQSWVIRGSNRPMTAEQIQQVMGSLLLGEMAATIFLSPQSLAIRLAYILPSAIDLLTPGGQLPARQLS